MSPCIYRSVIQTQSLGLYEHVMSRVVGHQEGTGWVPGGDLELLGGGTWARVSEIPAPLLSKCLQSFSISYAYSIKDYQYKHLKSRTSAFKEVHLLK